MIVGIDFGTTKSVVAANIGGIPTIIPDEDEHRYTPTVVAVAPDQSLRIGWEAIKLPSFERWASHIFTIESIKRSLGHQGEMRWGAFHAYPQEIAALIFGKLKLFAEARLNSKITGIILATPAYFNINERSALREAAEVAGLEVIRTIHEPTAAVLAYRGLKKIINETVAVFDLGGGSFDISILDIGDGMVEVKSTNGDTHLGGIDFTKAIVDFVCAEYKQNDGFDLAVNPEVMSRLTEAAEQAKCDLSSQAEITINLPFVFSGAHPKHLNFLLTRLRYEELIAPFLQRIALCCKQALADAQLRPTDIQKIILIGAASRAPGIVNLARELFLKEPLRSLDPTEAVALGASVLSAALSGDIHDVLLLDVTPISLGITAKGGEVLQMIPRNTTIPTKKSEIFTTTEDNQTEVTIQIVQGEKKIASENVLAGNITLRNLLPAPKGSMQIEVTFDIDTNCNLHVQGKDMGTGNSVGAILDKSDCCLNSTQIKVLRRKVELELQHEQDRINIWRNRVKQESSHEEANNIVHSITWFLTQNTCDQTAHKMILLKQGKELILDYLVRNATADDIDSLLRRIKPIFDQEIVNWCLNALDNIWSSPAFKSWVASEGNRTDHAKTGDHKSIELSECSKEIVDVRKIFFDAINRAKVQPSIIINAIAQSRDHRLCLELIISCFKFPDITAPDWAIVEPESDKSVRAILNTLARHAQHPHKRFSSWHRLCQLSDGSDIGTLLTAIRTEGDPKLAESLAQAIYDRFGEKIWKLYLGLDGRTQKQLQECPVICRLVSKPAIHALSGVDALLAINFLEGVASYISANQAQEGLLKLLEIQIFDSKPTENLKLIFFEIVMKAEGILPIELTMAYLYDPSPLVCKTAWTYLSQKESIMDATESRFIKVANKVLLQKKKINIFDNYFLRRLSKTRPEWSSLANRLKGNL